MNNEFNKIGYDSLIQELVEKFQIKYSKDITKIQIIKGWNKANPNEWSVIVEAENEKGQGDMWIPLLFENRMECFEKNKHSQNIDIDERYYEEIK
jgi:hypothetical protein